MNDFSITLNIINCCSCCSSSNTLEKSIIITDVTQTVELQNNYSLNVISVNDAYITILLQNGLYTYIRNVYLIYPTEICLPSSCITQYLKVSWRDNEKL